MSEPIITKVTSSESFIGGKTLRQIANEIGTSKQAVYKRYNGKLRSVCAPYAHTVNGVLYILERGETLIKQDFSESVCAPYAHTERIQSPHTERSVCAPYVSENITLTEVLRIENSSLREQLSVKDKQFEVASAQIEALNSRLAEISAQMSEVTSALMSAQETARAAQALHAGTLQAQLTDGRETSASVEPTASPRKGFWNRIRPKI
jgi:AcrR family transcriptional regulator